MNKLSSLPNVNLHLLNVLLSEDLNSLLLIEFGNLLERVFSVELKSIKVEIVRCSEKGNAPYIFYIGHQRCAVDVSFPLDRLVVSLPIKSERPTVNETKVSTLLEEHLALQGVNILRGLLFSQDTIIFQGKSAEELGFDFDCVSIKLIPVQENRELICRFNIFIPPSLQIGEDRIKEIKNPFPPELLISELDSRVPIPVSVFLGVLNINPSSLIEMLTAGNSINLPEGLSLDNCIFKMGDQCFGTGKLVESPSGNIFIFGENAKRDLIRNTPGFSSIFLRIYSGTIDPDKLSLNYPYYPLNMNWDGELEMLIGGEFVSKGILEYAGDGLMVKVC